VAAFEFRFDDVAGAFKEKELSTHWVEAFGPGAEFQELLAAAAKFVVDKVVPGERDVSNTNLFAVVPVQALHGARPNLVGTNTTFDCVHTPRIRGFDSHSSIYPNPGVDEWLTWGREKMDAYRHAVQAFIAAQVTTEAKRVKELAKSARR
jgi:hypothetical protein